MKRHPYDPKLEAALDELDAVLTAEAISNILLDLRAINEAETDDMELLPPADRPGRRGKGKRQR